MRIMPMTTASAIGKAPPDRLVPAPRGITRTPSRWQNAKTAASCSVLSGNATARGGWR